MSETFDQIFRKLDKAISVPTANSPVNQGLAGKRQSGNARKAARHFRETSAKRQCIHCRSPAPVKSQAQKKRHEGLFFQQP
ncbi:hypothetical protein [Pseudomonas chlororaphis]|uniref:hypothetical protein n=1 Tax=Pseudomonas chlororaphis TaxID=587753 RepID=UPI0011D05C67|nr:hypothetical protein [Pseudomonas chlororaphis]